MTHPDPFDLEIADLRHADSFKWTHYPPNVLPLFVADMDVRIAPSIRTALIDRLSHGVGYHQFTGHPEFVTLLRDKLHRQGIPPLPEKGGLHFVAGVVPGLYACVMGLTEPGDEVITMTPIYPPFLSAITDHGRVLRAVPLREPQCVDGPDAAWQIDFQAMAAAVTPKTRLLLLCHPHNPTGRLWTRDELARLAHFAEAHNLFVVSDELHADLTLDGTFVPFSSIASDALRARTLTLTGPCKAYNTAGLGIGVIAAHDPALLKRITKAVSGIASLPGAMSFVMWRAALEDDGQWLAAVLDALRDRRQMLIDFAAARPQTLRLAPPQATYLAWLDYRAHPDAANLPRRILEEAKVALVNGPTFGKGYDGFFRLNFATSRAILNKALERLATLEG